MRRALARRFQRCGVHDLVGGPPNLGEVEHGRRLVRLRLERFPEDHLLNEAPAVQVRPDGRSRSLRKAKTSLSGVGGLLGGSRKCAH